MLPITSAKAQLVFEEWVRPGGTQDFYVTGKSVSDPVGNTYQAGATLNAQGNYDAIITKYNQKGDEIWIKTFNGSSSGDDVFIDVVYFHSKIMATGVSRNAAETASDILTVKLSANDGSTDWENRFSYPGSIFNAGAALTIDESENVYVTGATLSYPALSDAIIIKYGATGALHWYDRQEISNGGVDVGVKIQYRGGIVTLVGATQTSLSSWRHLALAYNTNGTLLNTYFGTGNGADFEKVVDVVLDNQGNIYITGSIETPSNGYDMYTVKLDDELNLLWDNSYNFSGSGNDRAYSISMDNANNVIITGYSEVSPGNTQFTTVKYNNNGAQLWAKGYDISSGNDTAKVVTTDASGNIYVSGTFFNGSNQDLKTLKYDPSGNLVWEIDYNGVYNGDDYLLDMTHTGEYVIVMAQVPIDNSYRYVALKYVESDYESPQYPNSTEAFPNAFVKNLGQLCNENGHEVSSVKYLSKHGSYASFYKNSGFEWMTRTFHNDTTVNDTAQKVSFAFHNPVNGNKVNAFGRSEYFENYYFPYGIEKLERAPFYQKLYYGDIWRGVSMETGFKTGQEISFTVSAKGDPKYIGIEISGADSIVKIPAGDILLYTFNGSFLLKRPRAYQKNAAGNLTELPWTPAFSIIGGLLTINSIGSYNTQKDLIIRMSRDVTDVPETEGLCHSTYFGGSSKDVVSDITTDSHNNLITCGETGNFNFYSNTIGFTLVNENITNTLTSAFMAKFTSETVPLYSTFFSGSLNTWFRSVALKSNNNICLGGSSSGGNILIENAIGAEFQDATHTGASQLEGIIVELSREFGSLLYSTYFGSDGIDFLTGVAIDSQDRLYVIGSYFFSQNFNFQYLPGAYQNTTPGTNSECGYISRFNSDYALEWSVPIGGGTGLTDATGVTSIAISDNDVVAIAGVTNSSNMDISIIPETYQDLSIGMDDTDYYLMCFNDDAERIWASYENSGGGIDINLGLSAKNNLAFDNEGNLYFLMETSNVSDLNTLVNPGTTGAFFKNTNNGVGSYIVLNKYSPVAFSTLWRTLVMDGLEGMGNKAEAVYYSDNKLAIGGSTFDPSMTIESADINLISNQKSLPVSGLDISDFSDGFLMIFNTNNYNLLHSTYFGGTGAETSTGNILNSITSNNLNQMYFGGNTSTFYIDSDPGFIGIPVKNNQVSGNYFQNNLGSAGAESTLSDGYVSTLCLFDTPLNVSEITSSDRGYIDIHPNPYMKYVHSELSIKSEYPIERIVIQTTNGIQVASIQGKYSLEQQVQLSSYNLSSGLYILTIHSPKTISTSKLVLTK